MSFYHQTTRGWLARRLTGKQWLFLGLFLIFYAGLLFYGESLQPETQVTAPHELMQDDPDDVVSHHAPPEPSDSFLGLP